MSTKKNQDSPAQFAKDFIALNRFGSLATVSHTLRGYPFGSVIQYDLDANGQMIILISTISQHFQNLIKDPRASILVCDPEGAQDPQAYARATIVLDFAQCEAAEREELLASYWRRFPSNPPRNVAHDFVFFRGNTVRLRWIGGFGDIRWIDASDYQHATVDSIAYTGQGIISHMNIDHRDALAEFVQFYADVSPAPQPKACKMVAINSRDFTIALTQDSDPKTTQFRIPFAQPQSTPEDVRASMIAMLKDCRRQDN